MAQTLSTITIAVIAAAGGAGLVAVGLTVTVIRISKKHKRLLRNLENHGIEIPEAEVEEIPRQRAVLKRNAKFTFGKSEWNQLDSTESIQVALDASGGADQDGHQNWKPSAVSISNRPFPLRALKASPLLNVESIHSPTFLSNSPSPPPPLSARSRAAGTHGYYGDLGVLPPVDSDDTLQKPEAIFTRQRNDSQEELWPKPLFSSHTAVENFTQSEPRSRKKRSQTVTGSQPVDDPFSISQDGIISKHGRSFSFGSPPSGSVPDGPVPPLPVGHRTLSRPRSWLKAKNVQRPMSRQSASSLESIGSSVLIGSPKVGRSVSAKMKGGAHREWKNSLVHGPRPLRKALSMHDRTQSWSCEKSARSQKSIHSCEGQYSGGSPLDHHSTSQSQRNSAFEIMNCSSKSYDELNSITALTTNPRLITPGGSPKRLSSLRPHSASSPPLSPKSSGMSSTTSSNGNPFQWDPSPMQPGKPSAMKGSPSARKGHKRQQCVRISVPATVMGSRARSPTLSMADILEEGAEMTSFVATGNNSRPRSLPRPPSANTFNPELRTTLLRGSLTSSSPALSMVNFGNESSDHEPRNSAMDQYASMRISNLSMFEIPSFPSPVKSPLESDSQATFSYDRPIDEMNVLESGIPEEFKLLARPLSTTPPELYPSTDTLSNSEDSLERALFGSPQVDYQPETTLQPGEMILTFDSDGRIQVSPDNTRAPNSTGDISEAPFLHPDSPPISPKSQPQSHIQKTSSTEIPGLHILSQQISHVQQTNHTPRSSPLQQQTTDQSPLRPSPVRQSISLLRRMNSDVRNAKNRIAARRYMNIDRDGSPVARTERRAASRDDTLGLPGLGFSREDSMLEVQTEVDEMLAAAVAASAVQADVDFGVVGIDHGEFNRIPSPFLSAGVGSGTAVDDIGFLFDQDTCEAGLNGWNMNDVENLVDLQEYDAHLAGNEALEPLIVDREDSETFGTDVGVSSTTQTEQPLMGIAPLSTGTHKKRTPVQTGSRKKVSVWEDGDVYWQNEVTADILPTIENNHQLDQSCKTTDFTGAENMNPLLEHPEDSGIMRMDGSLHGYSQQEVTGGPVGGVGDSKGATMILGTGITPIRVNVVPPSNDGTPMSMYDAGGFLKY